MVAWPGSSPREEIRALWSRYRKRRDPEARDRLLDEYLGLVHRAVREAAAGLPRFLDMEDLLGAGTVGLVQALESFDPSMGFAFSTFAMPRIRGAIRDEIRVWQWTPRSVREKNRRLRNAEDALRRRLGREPEPEETAAELGMDLSTYRSLRDDGREPVVLPLESSPHPGEEETTLAEAVADPAAPDPMEPLLEAESRRELARAFADLPEKDRLVLTLCYYENLTLKQIGQVLHLSESRVSRIRSRALLRLKERIEPREKAA